MSGNFNHIIDIMSKVEKKDIELRTNTLLDFCQKDSDLARLIEIIYGNFEEGTVEYYMAKGMHNFLDKNHCVYSNINRINNRCNLIEEILEFIDSFIYTDLTDINNSLYTYNYFGVIITVNNDSIKFSQGMYDNMEDLIHAGYHNDAKYYLDKLNEFANNCVNKNHENLCSKK